MKAHISDSSQWYVARTGIRCEDRAASSLRSAGFDVYLPRMRKDIIHHRTKAVITKEFVLFNRYLFVGVESGPFHFGFARSCDGVESLLGVNGLPARVSAKIVREFREAEVEMEFDDTRKAKIYRGEIMANEKDELKAKFHKGLRVAVKEGHSFSGFYGSVVAAKGRRKVKAMIELLGGMVPVEFDARDLTPIDANEAAA